jgi:hypothetical protein
MPTIKSTDPNADYHAAVAEALETINDALERVMAGFTTLRSLLLPEAKTDYAEFDPKDPRNKYSVGGLNKLTPRGIEVCYRLFDAGKTRYAVCQLIEISFGAATHRLEAWKKLGGASRDRQSLE